MSRRDFAQLIREEGARLQALHLRARPNESRLDQYLERAGKKARYTDSGLLEFVVCFLEVDPWFYRSGYWKQILLTRVKRSPLSEEVKGRLRKVLLDAVARRGTREFKYYCRLAAVIADHELVAELETASASTDAAIARRARMMLGTVRQRQNSRAASTEHPVAGEP